MESCHTVLYNVDIHIIAPNDNNWKIGNCPARDKVWVENQGEKDRACRTVRRCDPGTMFYPIARTNGTQCKPIKVC